MNGFALFDTPIGRCALVWRGGLVVGAALPELADEAMRRSLSRRFPDAIEERPSDNMRAAIVAIVSALEGDGEDPIDIGVDLSDLPEFERSVLQATRLIPRGEIRTYGELASQLGSASAARAVGQALGRNPIPIIIPCHRVLAVDGRSGGFSAPGGVTTKMKILQIEGAGRAASPQLFEDLPLAMKPRV